MARHFDWAAVPRSLYVIAPQVIAMDKVHPLICIRGRQTIAAGMLLVMLFPSGGCRICAECDDLDYPAYGGAWQRTRRDGGRVGSVLDPAGAKTSMLVPRETPDKPDERNRKLRSETESDKPPMPGELKPENEDAVEPAPNDLEQRIEELRKKQLDDIKEEKEQEFRERRGEEIDVMVIPGDPLPPVLR